MVIRNPQETTLTPKKKVKRTHMFIVSAVDLDISEEEVIPG